jgi:hypothetical protein
MPSVTPGTTIAPGIVSATSGYPQYGVGGGSPGSSSGWTIVTANNSSQKSADETKGYLVWFTTKTAAQNFISSESSVEGSGGAGLSITNPLSFLEPIADFAYRLTEASTWLRVGEVIAGGMLVYLGLKSAFGNTAVGRGARQVSSAGKKTHSTARKIGKGVLEATVFPKLWPRKRYH